MAVVRKPADRPPVAASLRIYEWSNHLCVIQKPNKIKAVVVNRSKTGDPRRGDLVLSGVSICDSPNLDILGAKFDSMPPSKSMCVVLSPVSLNELVF